MQAAMRVGERLARVSHGGASGTTEESVAVKHLPSSGCGVIAVAALLAGCASAPTKQLGESQAALRAAEEVGAGDHPEAAYHLKLAEDQIAAAKELMDGNRKDKRMAKRHLQRAELDAELAIAYTRTAGAEERAKAAWHEVNELKQQGAADEAKLREGMGGASDDAKGQE
jgi:hypothetical protein